MFAAVSVTVGYRTSTFESEVNHRDSEKTTVTLEKGKKTSTEISIGIQHEFKNVWQVMFHLDCQTF